MPAEGFRDWPPRRHQAQLEAVVALKGNNAIHRPHTRSCEASIAAAPVRARPARRRSRRGFDQPIDPSFRCRLACGEADARLRNHVGHQFRCQRLGATKLCLQHTKVLLVFWIEQHDTSLRLPLRKWTKGHKETRWKKCPRNRDFISVRMSRHKDLQARFILSPGLSTGPGAFAVYRLRFLPAFPMRRAGPRQLERLFLVEGPRCARGAFGAQSCLPHHELRVLRWRLRYSF